MTRRRAQNRQLSPALPTRCAPVAIVLGALCMFGCGGGSSSGVPPGDSPGPANSPPILDAVQQVATNEDEPVTMAIPASDADSDRLTFEITVPPEHGDVSFDGGATPTLTYSPTAHYNGTDELRYRASDGRSVSSEATLTIDILPVDDPVIVRIVEVPVQAALTVVDLQAEILDVDGDGDSAVPVGWELPDFDSNGFLWSEQVNDLSVRARTPSRPGGATLEVRFSATDANGETIVDTLDLIVEPGPDHDGDGTTDFFDTDDDADGWADFVERQLGFDTLSAASHPQVNDAGLASLSIDVDSDADGISDVREEAWGRDPFDPRSVPPDTNGDGFPDFEAVLAIGRSVPINLELGLPLVMAAEVNSRNFDVGAGTAVLNVTFTAVSPVPITDIELALQIVETNSTRTLLQFFDRGVFPIASPSRVVAGTLEMPLNRYLPPSDYRMILVGNTEGFDYRGPPADPYLQSFLQQTDGTWSGDNAISIANSGIVDLSPPEVTQLTLQQDRIDLMSNERALSYQIELSDDLSGPLIHQLRITQTSGGPIYNRATDVARHSPASTYVQYSGTTNDIARDSLPGVLGGLDVLITDYAGNEITLSPQDLFDLGFPYFVEFENALLDGNPPNLVDFEILTPVLDRESGDRLTLRLTASDLEAEIREVVAVFHKTEAEGSAVYATFHAGRVFAPGESSTNAIIEGEPLGSHFHPGIYELYSITIFDRNDRRLDLFGADVQASGFDTRFEVQH